MAHHRGAGEGGKLPIPQMMLAASAAEVLGTSCLLPFEAIRIRMVANPAFGTGVIDVGSKLLAEQGIKGLYGGMVPILCKQIPFTITQFLVYEFASKAVYKALNSAGVEDASAKFGTGITLACGLMSGTAAALVSQPGDTVLSLMNKQAGVSVFGALKQLGPGGLYLGAGARCVHVTSYIVAQFLIYDSIKRLCGIPVAGEHAGKASAKPARIAN
jgi:solute carrier family 25 phosphate transporter 3